MKSITYIPPDELLELLGISEPNEIDIDAIAQYCGATVIYERIEGSEARIIGYKEQAIIVVNRNASPERRRFSAGHELGHWMRDRGKIAFACTEKMLNGEWNEKNPERRANEYAADLLLPEKMFSPLARNREITFDTVEDLASQFTTSLTATAIRVVQYGSFLAAVVCLNRNGRLWSVRNCDVPNFLRIKEKPGKGSLAYDLLYGTPIVRKPTDVYADNWTDHPDAHRYGICEDSKKIGSGMVLSLLWWRDESQIFEL